MSVIGQTNRIGFPDRAPLVLQQRHLHQQFWTQLKVKYGWRRRKGYHIDRDKIPFLVSLPFLHSPEDWPKNLRNFCVMDNKKETDDSEKDSYVST
jgi:hypothetical protein